jgi:hypothetical protein
MMTDRDDYPWSVFRSVFGSLAGRVFLYVLALCLGVTAASLSTGSDVIWPWTASSWYFGIVLASIVIGGHLTVHVVTLILFVAYLWKRLPHWVLAVPFALIWWVTHILLRKAAG